MWGKGLRFTGHCPLQYCLHRGESSRWNRKFEFDERWGPHSRINFQISEGPPESALPISSNLFPKSFNLPFFSIIFLFFFLFFFLYHMVKRDWKKKGCFLRYNLLLFNFWNLQFLFCKINNGIKRWRRKLTVSFWHFLRFGALTLKIELIFPFYC